MNKVLPIHSVISQTFSTYFSVYKKVFGYTFLMALAGVLVSLALTPKVSMVNALPVSLICLAALIVGLILFLTAYITLVKRIAASVNGTHAHFSYGQSFGYFWKTIGGGIFFFVSVGIAMLFFVLPGIFLAVSLCIYLPFLISENRPIFKGWRDCIALVWGSWWKTLLLCLFSLLLIATVFSFLFVVSGFILAFTTEFFYIKVAAMLSGFIARLIFAPFVISFALVWIKALSVAEKHA